MKKSRLLLSLSALLVGLLTTQKATAQFTSDSLNNTKIRDTSSINASGSKIVTAPNGNSFITWTEPNVGVSGYQTRIQLVDSNGYKLWGNKGLLVDSMMGGTIYRSDLKVDNAGNAIVAIQDFRSGTYWPVVFKIDQTGNFVWGNNGIQLTDTAANATSGLGPVIGITGNNNVVIAWNASGTKTYVSFQKFSPTGTVLWADPKRIIDMATTNIKKFERPQIVLSVDEEIILQYVQRSGSGLGTSLMYAQKYNNLGGAVWAAPTQLSTKTIAFSYFPTPIQDGYGGIFVSFNTSNPAGLTLNDVYAQRVYADGHTWNTDGYELVGGSASQRYEAGSVYAPGANKYFTGMRVTWTAPNAGEGIFVQKMDTSGVMQFSGTALQVGPTSTSINADVINVAATKNTDTGIVIVYAQGTLPSPVYMYATKVGYSGSVAWTIGSALVSIAVSDKGTIGVGDFYHNQLVAAWSDGRKLAQPSAYSNGSGIYAQNIRVNGKLGSFICPTITVAPGTLSAATVGVPINDTFTQTGGVNPITFSVSSGTLPSGVTLSNTGVLTGTDTLSGSYTFTVTATDMNGCSGSKTYTLQANCPTVALATLAQKCVNDTAFTLMGGTPAGGVYSGTGVVNGKFNPAVAGVGTHTIKYVYRFGNCADSASQSIVVIGNCGTSVNTVAQADLFECFPNPASNQVTVKLNQNISGSVRIKITSIDGRVILSDKQDTGNAYSKTFDLAGVAKGVYIIEVNSPKGTATTKLAVQ